MTSLGSTTHPTGLRGREAEQRVLDDLLSRTRAGAGGILLVKGPAGIGKSALIADAVRRAPELSVLRAVAVESESGLTFAGLHQLVRPIVSLIDDIPEPQAAALRSALGMAPPGGEDPFLVGAGLLSLLAVAAEDRPLLCVVEDLHWLDAASRGVVLFAARRLEAEQIAFVLSSRTGEGEAFDAHGLPQLRLEGLDDDAAHALLDEHGPEGIAPGVRREVIARAGGNPLLLLELPHALNDAQRAGREPLTELLPLTERLEETFRVRTDLLPAGTRLLLLVAAADNTGDPAVVLEAARALGIEQTAAEPAEAAGLLSLAEGHVEFRHSVVRSAVYGSGTFEQRRAVHRALAEALADERYEDSRAWQLAAATLGPDDDVADELERSAERARARGGYPTAALALARAASLTVDDEKRAGRLLAAAQAAAKAGQTRLAEALVGEARALATGAALIADIERLRGLLELEDGSPATAQNILLDAGLEILADDPARGAQLLVDAASAGRYGGNLEVQIAVGRQAEQLRQRLGPNFELTVSAGLGLLWADDPRGRERLEEAIRDVDDTQNPRRFLWAAVCALHLGDEESAQVFASRDEDLARREGALPDLVTALSRRAFAELVHGRFVSARANTSEGLALAGQAGLNNIAAYHQALLAWTEALLGAAEDAGAHAREALELARDYERAWQAAVATLALAEVALVTGRLEDAVAHFRAVAPDGPLRQPYLAALTAPSLVLAAVRADRPDVAGAAVERLERWVQHTGSSSQAPRLARSRALLATEDAAPARYEEALALHVDTPRPFEHALTALLYGEWLRRHGRRRDAQIQLRLAFELFTRVGAALWAERTAAELRASGDVPRAPEPSRRERLTPQELQVARFVATGATNKEVAAQLFLSPRTVDAHLRNIFAKLDISARTSLAHFELGDPPLDD